ncbi:transcobalamin-2 isoform X1 [Callorhinchus milii]|uniref:transcobalamin-2 isoform X1 n=2 Tax=Callorhinchus milii TaxID=7868 RepID=UPI001C3F928A|nr:transcobalamin-2 isoform X1 [Callorhinchus milii]
MTHWELTWKVLLKAVLLRIMEPRALLLFICAQVLFLPATLSSGVNDRFEDDVNSLSRRLLQFIQPSPAHPNPSFHIALRLATPHNLQDEQKYLKELKKHFKHKLKSCNASSGPSTGLIALYLLALQSSCQDMSAENTAITCLKEKLRAEKEHVRDQRQPLTNYYQYSLGVIALCLNKIHIHHYILAKLADGIFWENKSPHKPIDSVAMAALAFQCVQNASLPAGGSPYSNQTLNKVTEAVERLINHIQPEQQGDGTFKNIYSTSLGLQALCAMEPSDNCLRGRQRLVDEAKKGVFDNPMALAQLLPILYKKTLLDIKQITCTDSDDLTLLKASAGGEVEPDGEAHSVNLMVKDADGKVCYGEVTLPLRAGTSLLDVLEEAKRTRNFTFETKQTRWGPLLTSVNGMKEQKHHKIYWQLITAEKKALIHGIQDYHPQPGERIILRLSRY